MDTESWSNASDGTCRLVRLSSPSALLPNPTNDYLASVGVPSHVIFECDSAFEIRFAALAKPLVSYASLVKWGDFYDAGLEKRWQTRIIIADEEFCNGTACHCVNADTGEIVRTDCELSNPECFVNSSIQQFAAFARAAIAWSNSGSDDTAKLQSKLIEIDGHAMTNENGYWPGLFFHGDDYQQPFWRVRCDPSRSEDRF